MKRRVYITQPVHAGAIERLREVADVRWNPDPLHIMTKEELLAAACECDVL